MHNAYGSQRVLKEYLDLKSCRIFRIPEIVWHHGWNPDIWNYDIDQIVGESGQTSELAHLTYFVARADQEAALREAGLPHVTAIGLPFAYALKIEKQRPTRIPNSIIVVPALHGRFDKEASIHMDTEYLDFLERKLGAFDHIRVLMNCDDIRLGRNAEWERRGYTVLLGGCEDDDESLSRLVTIFRTFDVMATNDFGSPIAYAAASGCRVAVSGPPPSIDIIESDWSGTFSRSRVDLWLSADTWFSQTKQVVESAGLLRKPEKAIHAEEWAKQEIGFDMVRPPEELVRIIREAYLRHTSLVDRLGMRPIRKRLESLNRLLEVSLIRQNSSNAPNIFTWAKNVLALTRLSGHSAQQLQLTDSGHVLHFRPGSSDLDSIHQHFVERPLGEIHLEKPTRILDIGSYAGYSMLSLALTFPEAEIIGIEADSESFQLCQQNHAGYPNRRVLRKAVWFEDGRVSVLPGPDRAWSNRVIPYSQEFPEIEAITLPSLLEQIEWSSVDLMKVDIQGAEYDALRKMASEMRTLCSVLAVKFHHKLARKKELDALISQITSGTHASVAETGDFTVFDFRRDSPHRDETAKPQ